MTLIVVLVACGCAVTRIRLKPGRSPYAVSSKYALLATDYSLVPFATLISTVLYSVTSIRFLNKNGSDAGQIQYACMCDTPSRVTVCMLLSCPTHTQSRIYIAIRTSLAV